MLYFERVFAGTELFVEGSFEEEAKEGVGVGGEEGGLGVCEFGHDCKGGPEEELGMVKLCQSEREKWLTGEEDIDIVANDRRIELNGRIDKGVGLDIFGGGLIVTVCDKGNLSEVV